MDELGGNCNGERKVHVHVHNIYSYFMLTNSIDAIVYVKI